MQTELVVLLRKSSQRTMLVEQMETHNVDQITGAQEEVLQHPAEGEVSSVPGWHR